MTKGDKIVFICLGMLISFCVGYFSTYFRQRPKWHPFWASSDTVDVLVVSNREEENLGDDIIYEYGKEFESQDEKLDVQTSLDSLSDILDSLSNMLDSFDNGMDRIKLACDYVSPQVRALAMKILKNSSGTYSLKQCCDIYDYVYDHWVYISDPSADSDFIPQASDLAEMELKQGLVGGDCEDSAILIASLIRTIGGASRVMVAETHAHAELYLCKEEDTLLQQQCEYIYNRYGIDSFKYHLESDSSVWLPLDLGGHPGILTEEEHSYAFEIYP